jgi:hypothetical protein
VSALELAWAGGVLASGAYWLVVAYAGWRTRRALTPLARVAPPAPARWPRVTLVVPARDEQAELEAALTSRLADDYPALEVVVVDDRSRDATGRIADALAARDGRVCVVHVRELPEGWLGKNHALHVGAQTARGEWLLFSDADVHFRPGALRRAVAWSEAHGLDHLAVVPELWQTTFWLDVALAAFGRSFAMSRRVWRVADPRSAAAVGVGAFNLVRRSALERSAGFPWLALDVADDVALGLLLKRSGARCGVAQGTDLVGVAWYRDLPAMARGLEKNTFALFGCSLARVAAATAAYLMLELGAFVGLVPAGPVWVSVVAAGALLPGLVIGAVAARETRRPVVASLLAPASALLMGWILLRAGLVGRRRGGVDWRGTHVPAATLRGAQRVRPLG